MTAMDVKISDLCGRLIGLLENPEPGLATWHKARRDVAKRLLDALTDALRED